MNSTSEKLKNVLENKPVKNQEKLEKQQNYYKKLSNNGIAKKQTYKLKSLSSI